MFYIKFDIFLGKYNKYLHWIYLTEVPTSMSGFVKS